jgi:Ca2+-binding RTX toxin-like protein
MPLTGAEQYLLELINRARLDPAAEAARYGVDLNAGLAPGTITPAARQVLAPDDDLALAAARHSEWMIATDTFSHTGSGGSSAGARASDAGYDWNRVGENLAMLGTTGSIDIADAVAAHHAGLFRSAGHRANMLDESYREIGIGQEIGGFTQGGTTYNASLLTEVFGVSGSRVYVTGVAYSDSDRDAFYSVGEGQEGVVFTAAGQTGRTEEAGGYALAVEAAADVEVTGRFGNHGFDFSIDTRPGNVKVDLVNGEVLRSSGDIDLGRGISQVQLLGLGDIDAAGSGAWDRVWGNAGDNLLSGEAGRDVLAGRAGQDRLVGGHGHDRLWGGFGGDVLTGGHGNDTLWGGRGADHFVFGEAGGRDMVRDLSRAEGDRIVLDDALWDGADLTAQQVVSRFAERMDGDIVLVFDGQTQLRLDGVGSAGGLADLMVLV